MKIKLLITLLGLGLSMAVKADPAMDRLIVEGQQNVDNESVVVYGGHIGKTKALFFLEWDSTNKVVDGHYQNLEINRSKTYKLKGHNKRDGVLELDEFIEQNGKLVKTAHLVLTKKLTKDKIMWSGTMHNTDGRKLEVSFYRPRG